MPSILGHLSILDRFRRALRRDRMPSTFLFVGPPGVGKRTVAMELARGLLCETPDRPPVDPCGVCPSCRQVEAVTHPDLAVIEKPADKAFIPVELFIGDREHRNRAGLCHQISRTAFRGGWKIGIIDDADYLNQEGANCLLKTLEEPPPRSVLILIGTSQHKQLATIQSRCQIVRFGLLSDEDLATLILRQKLADTRDEALALARRSDGSLADATELADPELAKFQDAFVGELSAAGADSTGLARSVTKFVDDAGKEAPRRRARLRQVIRMAMAHYRQTMRDSAGIDRSDARVIRCLDALEQLDANANQATLIDCWIDDLVRAQAAGGKSGSSA